MSDCIRLIANWHSHVFLINSCLPLFSAASQSWHPLSRSYRVILPNSLTVNRSSALVYSTRLRVSVYGTDATIDMFSGFSWQFDYLYFYAPHGIVVLSVSTLLADLPTRICVYILQPSIPSDGNSVTPASPHHSIKQYRNINRFVHRHCRSA